MSGYVCDRCNSLFLDNPQECRNCGYYMFQHISDQKILQRFSGVEACCHCNTIHVNNPHECITCGDYHFREVDDEEQLERIEEVVQNRTHDDSQTTETEFSRVVSTLKSLLPI